MLLEKGSDPMITDAEGKTPGDLTNEDLIKQMLLKVPFYYFIFIFFINNNKINLNF